MRIGRWWWLALVVAAILLAGCGQKGDLYLPEPETEQEE